MEEISIRAFCQEYVLDSKDFSLSHGNLPKFGGELLCHIGRGVNG